MRVRPRATSADEASADTGTSDEVGESTDGSDQDGAEELDVPPDPLPLEPMVVMTFNVLCSFCDETLLIERTTMEAGDLPVVVVGDFNSQPDSAAYALLDAALTNSFDLAQTWSIDSNQDPVPTQLEFQG